MRRRASSSSARSRRASAATSPPRSGSSSCKRVSYRPAVESELTMTPREAPPLPSLDGVTGSPARTVLLASAAVTLVLYMLPYGEILSRPFLLLSTLAHEMGHGLTS